MQSADLRAAWSGLTPRGTSFLTAGVVAMVSAFLLRQPDLVRVASLLAALPVAVVLWMAVQRLGVTVARTADPPRGSVGEPVQVSVSIRNTAATRTSTLLFEDSVPAGMTAGTRVVVPPLQPRETARICYEAVPTRRGSYRLGPARLTAVEPFGLVERIWQASAVDTLLVRPQVHLLEQVLPARRAGRGGDSERGGIGVVGEPDLSVREYRYGDDLRRVHWPTTARRGQMMVRPEQQPQDHNAVVLLDSRAAGHRGDADTGSLEMCVSAAASALVHAAGTGHRVVLVGDGDPTATRSVRTVELTDQGAEDDVEVALDRLGLLRTTGVHTLAGAVADIAATAPSLVVVVLGEIGPEDVEALAGVARDAARVALICVSTTWEHLGGARRDLLDERREAAAARLDETGWRVAWLRAGDSVPEAWSRLADHPVHA